MHMTRRPMPAVLAAAAIIFSGAAPAGRSADGARPCGHRVEGGGKSVTLRTALHSGRTLHMTIALDGGPTVTSVVYRAAPDRSGVARRPGAGFARPADAPHRSGRSGPGRRIVRAVRVANLIAGLVARAAGFAAY